MACPPDPPLAEMCEALSRRGAPPLARRSRSSHEGLDEATETANAALKAQRQLEKVYRDAMASLLAVPDLREVTARRELYRRVARMGDVVVDVAERVWYTIVKEG